MADYLASIFATEKDKVNCSFYFKIGACRHGLRCTKSHNVPSFSQTVLLRHLYMQPATFANVEGIADLPLEQQEQQYFDDIYEELFVEMEEKYGELEELVIIENVSDHLLGNTYVKFRNEEDAEKACQDLNNRWFNGKPIFAELSPVTDFQDASCQFRTSDCPRGGFCNFLHLKQISRSLRHKLFKNTSRWRRFRRDGGRSYSRSRSRSRSNHHRRSRSRSPPRRSRSPSRTSRNRNGRRR